LHECDSVKAERQTHILGGLLRLNAQGLLGVDGRVLDFEETIVSQFDDFRKVVDFGVDVLPAEGRTEEAAIGTGLVFEGPKDQPPGPSWRWHTSNLTNRKKPAPNSTRPTCLLTRRCPRSTAANASATTGSAARSSSVRRRSLELRKEADTLNIGQF